MSQGEIKMSIHQEKESSKIKTEILTVRLPEDLMRKIEVFCTNNDMLIEQFAVDALLEKLSRWKE
jgi:hypothetical protein